MAVLIVGILIVSGALLRFVFAGGRPAAPRTELERAVFEASEAVKANPDDATARIKLAAAYLEEHSNGRALEQAQYAVRLDPATPGPYYVLGLAQDANGKTAEAAVSLKRAADTKGQLAQFYQDVYVALARVLEKQGKTKDALNAMDRAVNQGPENIIVLMARGNLNERQKLWLAAATDYVWSLYYDPGNTEAQAAYNRIAKDHPAEAKKAADAVAKTQAEDKAPDRFTPTVTAPATGTK